MLLNDLDNAKIALIFAHYAYRNTEVEDLHAGDSVIMDDDVYSKVYNIVSAKIRSIKRNNKVILEIKDENDLISKLNSMGGPRPIEILGYLKEMLFYVMYPFGLDWDAPVLLEDEIPRDHAAYILRGAFSECCNQHRRLDDDAMCYINKDVYNRFYTLVVKGIL